MSDMLTCRSLAVENRETVMKTVSVKVDDAFLERIRKVCKWEKKTQDQLVKSALEDRMKLYVKQLEKLERTEEQIIKSLPHVE